MFEKEEPDVNYDITPRQYYGPSDYDFGYNPKKPIKKYIQTIGLVLIVLIMAFLFFSWFSNQAEMTINLVDPDGNPVEGRIILKDTSGNQITVEPKGTATSFKAKVPYGTYRITATAENYKTVNNKSIVLNGDEKEFDISLLKNIKASLTVELPEQEIFEDQIINGKLSIINSGPEFKVNEITPIVSAPLELKITSPTTGTISTNGTMYLDFDLKIKPGTNLKEEKKATINFKVSGSDTISNKIELHALPSILEKETKITANLTNTTLTAGEEKIIQISIQNMNTKIPIKKILVEIEPNKESEEKLSWFRFNSPIEENEQATEINSIDPSGKEIITLYVKPSLTATVGEEFKGNLKITSYSIKGTPSQAMNFKVSTAKKAEIEFYFKGKKDGGQTTITCNKDTKICNNESLSNGEVYVKNTGNIDITQIQVEIDLHNPNTTQDCLQFVTNFKTITPDGKTIPILKPDKQATIITDITAPQDAPINSIARCIIKISYIDPLSEPPLKIEKNGGIIEITKKES